MFHWGGKKSKINSYYNWKCYSLLFRWRKHVEFEFILVSVVNLGLFFYRTGDMSWLIGKGTQQLWTSKHPDIREDLREEESALSLQGNSSVRRHPLYEFCETVALLIQDICVLMWASIPLPKPWGTSALHQKKRLLFFTWEVCLQLNVLYILYKVV